MKLPDVADPEQRRIVELLYESLVSAHASAQVVKLIMSGNVDVPEGAKLAFQTDLMMVQMFSNFVRSLAEKTKAILDGSVDQQVDMAQVLADLERVLSEARDYQAENEKGEGE